MLSVLRSVPLARTRLIAPAVGPVRHQHWGFGHRERQPSNLKILYFGGLLFLSQTAVYLYNNPQIYEEFFNMKAELADVDANMNVHSTM